MTVTHGIQDLISEVWRRIAEMEQELRDRQARIIELVAERDKARNERRCERRHPSDPEPVCQLPQGHSDRTAHTWISPAGSIEIRWAG